MSLFLPLAEFSLSRCLLAADRVSFLILMQDESLGGMYTHSIILPRPREMVVCPQISTWQASVDRSADGEGSVSLGYGLEEDQRAGGWRIPPSGAYCIRTIPPKSIFCYSLPTTEAAESGIVARSIIRVRVDDPAALDGQSADKSRLYGNRKCP